MALVLSYQAFIWSLSKALNKLFSLLIFIARLDYFSPIVY